MEEKLFKAKSWQRKDDGQRLITIAHHEHFMLRWAKNRIYSKQVLHLTSTPPLSKIISAGILSIWQKETTSSHIWTAIKFEYFDLSKIRFIEIPWFFPDFQQNFKFPDFSLQRIFLYHFSCFPCFPECVATTLQKNMVLARFFIHKPANWLYAKFKDDECTSFVWMGLTAKVNANVNRWVDLQMNKQMENHLDISIT